MRASSAKWAIFPFEGGLYCKRTMDFVQKMVNAIQRPFALAKLLPLAQ